MVVRVERVLRVPAPQSVVWEFIDDPEHRARNISVVESCEVGEDGSAVWNVNIPVPLVDRTIAIETDEDRREPPNFVSFSGDSRAFSVTGEHHLEADGDETILTNRFVVDGKVPGVEAYFRRKLGDELDNLEDGLSAYLERREA